MTTYQKYATAVGIIATLGFASLAVAQTATTTSTLLAVPLVQRSYPAPQVVQIDGLGNALIRGTVRSVATSSIQIDTWGGTWTFRSTPNTVVFARSTLGQNDLTGISVGDFVGAQGRMALDQALTVDVSVVRDWTTAPLINGVTATGITPFTLSGNTANSANSMSSSSAATSTMNPGLNLTSSSTASSSTNVSSTSTSSNSSATTTTQQEESQSQSQNSPVVIPGSYSGYFAH